MTTAGDRREAEALRDPVADLSGAAMERRDGGGGWTARLARRVALGALERWQVGRLTVHLPDGRTVRAGAPDAEPHATLWVRRDAFFRDLLLRGDLGAGEAYMAGDWRADDLPRFVELALLNQRAVAAETWLSRVVNVPTDVLQRLRRNTRRGSRRNIRAHYDLGNDFFALFLDPTMTYSSAIFASPGESLDQAQRHKFAHLAAKLDLRASDHVLEIGCGWGAFAIHAAEAHGCRVTGLTISREQHELATRRVAEAGLSGRVEIRLCDYRDVRGRFDKIVSIEMLEAVGRDHWATYFEQCDRLLAPAGLVGIQTIAIPDHRFRRYARHADWIQKYIFPGGLLPSIGEICRATMRRTSLTIRHLEDIGPHYAETLARWRAAFLARLPEVRALGFDERFVRMWDFYLATCEASFRTRVLGDLQLVLARAGGGTPLA